MLTEEPSQISQEVVHTGVATPNGEAGIERQRVACPNSAHDGEDRGQIHPHTIHYDARVNKLITGKLLAGCYLR
jgi:hypothetical protein